MSTLQNNEISKSFPKNASKCLRTFSVSCDRCSLMKYRCMNAVLPDDFCHMLAKTQIFIHMEPEIEIQCTWLHAHWTYGNIVFVFTLLYGMQMRSSDENSFCLSVGPSVKRVIFDKMEERSVQIFISYERSFSLVFWEEEWLVGVTPSTWNFGSTDPYWSEIADFQPIFTRSSSAITPSEKVQLTLIGSPLRAFQWA